MKRGKIIKFSKIILILATALYFTLVAFGNLTDYNSNFGFVRHVLSMDTTFEGNSLMWRAITSPIVHHIVYWIIIVWELVIACFLWIAGIKCLGKNKKKYEEGISKGVIGLVLGLLLWFLVFIIIEGEWFAMWQSSIWNAQDIAFRMFVINGIILLYLLIKE